MHKHYGILLVLGLSSFLSLFCARFFQKMKIPQVVGYILIGLILGQSGLGIIDQENIDSLNSFTFFALGIIGFLVGGELRISDFKKYGGQFFSILMGEGMAAFILVGISSTFLLYLMCHNQAASLAGGIVLGAVASATDPASTIGVLWEYRAKGIVTTALTAIIALDDALAMALYSIGKSISSMLVGAESSLVKELFSVLHELGGAVLIGVLFAVLFKKILVKIHDQDTALAVSVSALLFIVGLSVSFGMDVILAAMTFGFCLINMMPHRTEKLFSAARSMSIPIYVLFFAIVGARFKVSGMPPLVWWIAGTYVILRSLGKFFGTYSGARISHADKNVTKYAGYGLFAQGGVAIGLAIVAGHNLKSIQLTPELDLGECVVAVVTATTIAVQLIGPFMTRLALKYSGEMNRNITEEDVMRSMRLNDIIYKDTSFAEGTSVLDIVNHFSTSPVNIKTVKNDKGQMTGVISLNSLREVLPESEMWNWVLAVDIMDESYMKINSDSTVSDAINYMVSANVESIVVVDKDNGQHVEGIIEFRKAKNIIQRELLKRLG